MLGSQEQIGVNGANLSPTQLVATHTDSTVWMRAALIAVPLAGTLILLLLVLVACWLLKFDLKYLSDSSRLLQEEKNLFLTKKPTVAAKNEYVDGCHSLIHSTTSLKAKLISPQGSNDISSTVHPTGVRRLFCPTQPNLLPWKPFASPVQQPIFTPSRRQYDCESAAAETTVSEESQQLCDKDTIMSSHLPLSP